MDEPDRTTRYVARLDAHLAALPGHSERSRFLARELDTWEQLYTRFVRGDLSALKDPPTAYDYFLTIAHLADRLHREQEENHPCMTP